MSTTVRSHAKVNLGLGIGAPRPDGFHALVTVYQTLDAHDLVSVSARPAPTTQLRLTSNDHRVPVDNRNTAWKIVELALRELDVTAEVDIHIEKRLPVQGGLGAGSANAVAALVGLEVELERQGPGTKGIGTKGLGTGEGKRRRGDGQQASKATADPSTAVAGATFAQDDKPFFEGAGWGAKRLEIAAMVGSDVPLFLIGGTVLGLDRGQDVFPLPDLEPLWCVVAAPAIGVSTPQAFRDWDALCSSEGLTAQASTDKLNMLSRAYASAFGGGIPGKQQQGVGSSGVLPKKSLMEKDLAGPQESALVRTGITSWIRNDFERVVFRQHPSLAEIKRILAASGTPEAAPHASLSGSGSALFGLYLAREEAEAALSRLERFQEVEVRGILTRTLPRKEYWSRMLEII
jgi:4-diphosphocytidyl-2-C-methyl-D-erythritol kinase